MIKIVRTLEPRRLDAGKIIYKTIQEVDEIYFIEKGSVDIGFEVNREPNYVIRLQKGGVVGIYNVTFDKKTVFIYKVKTCFEGFSIRKSSWKQIIHSPDHEDLTFFMKKQIQYEYNTSIKDKVIEVYNKVMNKLVKRNDQQEILQVMGTKS